MSDIFQIFPRATCQERAELRSSIQAVGLRNPVVVDEHGSVIDGHERRDICTELGIDWLAGADVRIGLIVVQKKALAIELNPWRRPTKPGDTILDPQVRTGTNAVACSLLGDRTFIGCDIGKRKVRTTRYRLATEDQQKSA